ncbi:MAG: phenylalanine--tRNA ligase subunit beta, partial [Pygmaiobacter sp.]
TTAVPSLLEVVARNYNARAAEVALFENATEYLPADDAETLPTENEKLILAMYGEGHDYLALKGIVEKLLATAGIREVSFVRNTEGTTYHPGRAANVFVDGIKIGVLGEVHPKVLANYGIKPRTCVADLSFDLLFEHRGGTPEFKPLPKHPAITRDLALVCDEAVPAAEIAARIQKGAGQLLESLALFDIYRGENLGSGKKSLAYNLVLRTSERTLTDEEADGAVQKILANLAQINIVLRS